MTFKNCQLMKSVQNQTFQKFAKESHEKLFMFPFQSFQLLLEVQHEY